MLTPLLIVVCLSRIEIISIFFINPLKSAVAGLNKKLKWILILTKHTIKMPSDLIPEQFTDLAMEEIVDYLAQNRERWENKTEEEIDEFKEEVEQMLFNTVVKFETRYDCTTFIDGSADLIFCVVDYVAGMDENYGGLDKSLIAQFNRCWLYTGMEMIRDEWEELIEKANDNYESDYESDSDDEPMEG
jgi:hypothetical protein